MDILDKISLKNLINKFYNLKNTVLQLFGIKRHYLINGQTIYLDYKHLLPLYQKQFPHYDTFLSILAKYLPQNSTAIDIGANVGDTLAGMVGTNDKIKYVCIESSKKFYKDLQKNVELIKKSKRNLDIILIREFVGKKIDNVSLEEESRGTAKVIIGDGHIKSKELFNILEDKKIKKENVSLIKTDVDGNDWDVIESAQSYLTNKPYLFFECDYKKYYEYKKFKELFFKLKSLDYAFFSFFDNFGQYICTLSNLDQINELLEYIEKQNFFNGTRTFFYFDVLAFNNEKKKDVDEMLQLYKLNRNKLV